ncbi:CHASE2 domain-containing protein [Dokdonia pacifica]|uniref:CHASE2 domain-containing protein n=1 Tax=Dokdonia pacifica TaxID=1627892 RepID=UPI0015C59FD1|nr:CHASE2 domain-containing protein [Dokdonia pacifica]
MISLFFPMILLILNYTWSNESITNQEEERLVTKLGLFLKNAPMSSNQFQKYADKILLINVSNDKELINVKDYQGIDKGNLDITNRGKLADFLNKTNNKHRYILLDIAFNPNHESPFNDEKLYQAINNTKNIVLPIIKDKDSYIIPKFSDNIGFASYQNSIFTNRFIKYSYLENDSLPSIALKMGNQLLGTQLEKKGMFYYDNDRLAWNSIILDHPIKPLLKYNSIGEFNYFDLGVDILQVMPNSQIENFVENKIIIIGDFDDRDLHPTIYGEIPGALIIYNAFLALENGQHIVVESIWISLYIIYLLLILFYFLNFDKKCILALKRVLIKSANIRRIKSFFEKISLKNMFFTIISDYLKIGLLFTSLSVLYFLIYGVHIEILGTSSIFATLIVIRNLYTNFKLIKKNDI